MFKGSMKLSGQQKLSEKSLNRRFESSSNTELTSGEQFKIVQTSKHI